MSPKESNTLGNLQPKPFREDELEEVLPGWVPRKSKLSQEPPKRKLRRLQAGATGTVARDGAKQKLSFHWASEPRPRSDREREWGAIMMVNIPKH